MLEVLIGVGGFVVGYGVNWYLGHAAFDAAKDELLRQVDWCGVLTQELEDARAARLVLRSELGEAESRYDRIADAYATTHGKIAAIRDLIADTTRVRSSRIREVLGE